MLTVNDVKKVYSGKPGCMCGCRGDYNDDKTSRGFKVLANRVLKSVNAVYALDGQYAYLDSATRHVVVYFKD